MFKSLKIVAASFMVMASTSVFAQKSVTLKAGTIVPLSAVNTVKAADVNVGQTVDFRVVQDVKADGEVVIPAGMIVKGSVYEAKRSTAFGTKGRLGIRIQQAFLENGESVFFTSSDVYITGKNMTPLSVIVFFFTCLPFPCGSKAVMPAGHEVMATVANNVTITK